MSAAFVDLIIETARVAEHQAEPGSVLIEYVLSNNVPAGWSGFFVGAYQPLRGTSSERIEGRHVRLLIEKDHAQDEAHMAAMTQKVKTAVEIANAKHREYQEGVQRAEQQRKADAERKAQDLARVDALLKKQFPGR
jgi:hypothetical protein